MSSQGTKKWSVVKHCSGTFNGHVQCEYCKKIIELKKPIYYAIYEKISDVCLGNMVGFACQSCFEINVERASSTIGNNAEDEEPWREDGFDSEGRYID